MTFVVPVGVAVLLVTITVGSFTPVRRAVPVAAEMISMLIAASSQRHQQRQDHRDRQGRHDQRYAFHLF
jgi:hypothetical protein